MKRVSFIVIQIAPGVRPGDRHVPKGLLTGAGVFVPVSCDGFYSRAEDAHEVAAWLAEEFPQLQTIVAEVAVANDPEEPGEAALPSVASSRQHPTAASQSGSLASIKPTPLISSNPDRSENDPFRPGGSRSTVHRMGVRVPTACSRPSDLCQDDPK